MFTTFLFNSQCTQHLALIDPCIVTKSCQKNANVAELLEVSLHYEKKLTKNITPTDILQIYTSI